jgi:hypothetical protein
MPPLTPAAAIISPPDAATLSMTADFSFSPPPRRFDIFGWPLSISHCRCRLRRRHADASIASPFSTPLSSIIFDRLRYASRHYCRFRHAVIDADFLRYFHAMLSMPRHAAFDATISLRRRC